MIPKITVLTILLGLNWQQAVYGAAYSKVYVQNGPDVIPVEYLNYGAPPVVTNAQIAQLSGPPVGSLLPNLVAPCVAPCILPDKTIGTVAEAQPSAKFTTYNSPKVPTVVAPTNDEKSSYEYSYVVYDEITGDRKAQRELSDGSVVQGEYSFIQPDGYVREVTYTADDLSGFNAVVKNFLPSEFGKEKIPELKSDATLPCQDIKKEAIKMEPEAESPNHIEPAHEEVSMTTQKESHEPAFVSAHKPTHELAHDHDNHNHEHGPEHDHDHDHHHDHNHDHHHDHHHDHDHDHDHDHTHEHDHDHDHDYPQEHDHDHDHPHDHDHDQIYEHELEQGYNHEHVHSEDIGLKVIPTVEVATAKVTSAEPEPPTITIQELAAQLVKGPLTNPDINQIDSAEAFKTHESLQKPAMPEASKPMASLPNGLVSYSDIIKCVQEAIANNSNIPKTGISPLTYIILPGTNKPC